MVTHAMTCSETYNANLMLYCAVAAAFNRIRRTETLPSIMSLRASAEYSSQLRTRLEARTILTRRVPLDEDPYEATSRLQLQTKKYHDSPHTHQFNSANLHSFRRHFLLRHRPILSMASNLKRKAADLPSSSPSDPKKPKGQASLTSFFGPPKTTVSSSAPPSSPLSTSVRNSTLKDPTSSPPDPTSTKPTSTDPATATLADAAPAPIVKTFDKKAWAAKLTTEQRELLTLEIATLHESWFAHLKDELVTKEFLDLKRFLKAERASGKKIFPPAEDVYSWSVFPPTTPTRKGVY
jgi:hypothetical protein